MRAIDVREDLTLPAAGLVFESLMGRTELFILWNSVFVRWISYVDLGDLKNRTPEVAVILHFSAYVPPDRR